eukprot:TRINITY_DN5068_c0_g1_i1.p1 TRINITY_DN5068_c0_g1~~TRINITY_DN5068_c0_g1_i1.p1  ORF type:complete len:474 (-),score=98.83 TRINITY_DN5068_c0_g1_i1:24-1445(-)
MNFEEIIDSDSLNTIFSFLPVHHRLPPLFVNRRWRDAGYKSHGSLRNFQEAHLYKASKSKRRMRELRVHWYINYAASKSLELLKWCVRMKCPWDHQTLNKIALSGNVEALKWAIAEGYPWDPIEALRMAAKRGHLELIKWIMEECKSKRLKLENRYVNPCVDAAENGHLETFLWLLENGSWDNFRDLIRWRLVSKDKDEVYIEMCLERGKDIGRNGYFEDLETANWILQNRHRFPNIHFMAKCPTKKEEYEQYMLLVKKHNFNVERILMVAAECGDLDIFIYAERAGLSEGIQKRLEEFIKRASTSNMELYKWLRERSPHLPAKVVIKKWNFPIGDLPWALENGMELNGSESLIGLVNSQSWEAAKFALKSGIKWEKKVAFESIESLQFAINNGFKMCRIYFMSQLIEPNCDVLNYAHLRACPWNKKKCYKRAIKCRLYTSIKWIELHSTSEERGGMSLKDILKDKTSDFCRI